MSVKIFFRLFFFLFLVFNTPDVFSQKTTIHISGRVISNANQNPVEDASIRVMPVDSDTETGIGIATNRDGLFDLHFNYTFPFRIVVSHVSYLTYDVVIRKEEDALNMVIPLASKVLGEEVVVTAPLATEKELKETQTIDRISATDVQQLASFDVYDLVSTLREVDVATQSMTMQSVNTRGFNASANKRFLQLTDGIDNRAPGLSFPIGNLLGLPDVDVAAVDILPGPSSTKYGSSALNGVLLMRSRDPFEDQGIAIEAKTGVNELDVGGSSFFAAEGNAMYEVQGRYAKALSDKFALKFTGLHTAGTDWRANNKDNIGFGVMNASRNNQPGYNGVNTYGDESYIYLQVHADGEPTQDRLGNIILPPLIYGPVTRTGYFEEHLVDYDITTTRLSGSVHYKFNEKSRIELGGKYGHTNSLYTGDSRIRLQNFRLYQTNLRLKLEGLEVMGYTTWQNSGDSFDVVALSENLIQRAKPDEYWYRDFYYAYSRGIPAFGIRKGDLKIARDFADSGTTLLSGTTAEDRYEPGTEEFKNNVSEITSSTDPEEGAAFIDNSHLYHVQSAYQIPEIMEDVSLSTGANFRFYDLDSEGTIFPDTASNNITNYEYGGFLAVEMALFDEALNINSALRIDKNENFKSHLSPQLSLNYSLNDKHYFRASFQHGFRYPGIREQFVNDDLGKARLLGGLRENVDQYNLQENAFTLNSLTEFREAVNNELSSTSSSPENYNRTQAEIKHLPILEEGIVQQDFLVDIKPELVNTFEIGYKRLFTTNFFLDLNYYVSFYENFIGITRVIKPRTSPQIDLLVSAGQANSSLESERFYIYSNSEERLLVHGASFVLDYRSGGFLASLNASYAKLIQSADDPLTPGFNTPPFKLNFDWGHRELIPNLGFKMTYRYRTEFFWESSFVDGPIDSYGHFDFQFNVRMPSVKSTVKFGVTNLGVEQYSNIYGGPSIGSILFVTYNYNPKSF